jgi:hypothetical protein
MRGGIVTRVIVDVHCGSVSESWIVIHPDGSMVLHEENNGPLVFRRGLEKRKLPSPEGDGFPAQRLE